MKLKVLIADDDDASALALQIMLKRYCGNSIELLGTCTTVKETLRVLKDEFADLIFLDIELPDGSGFDVLDAAAKKIKQVVFITAHSNYAIQAIKRGAIDYFLKPISQHDLTEVIKKAQHKNKGPSQIESSSSRSSIPVSTSRGHFLLNKQDILYIKANGRYSLLVCTNGDNFTVCKNIGEYEDDLSKDFFFRVHRSYLVNCNHVIRINNRDGGFVEINNNLEIEISKRKRSEFLKFLR